MNFLNILLILFLIGVVFIYNGFFFSNKILYKYFLYLINIIFFLLIILWFLLDKLNLGF